MNLLPAIRVKSTGDESKKSPGIRRVKDSRSDLLALERQLEKSRRKFQDIGMRLRKQEMQSSLETAGFLARRKLLNFCKKGQIAYMEYLQDRVNLARETGEPFLERGNIAPNLLPADTQAFYLEYRIHASQDRWREAWFTLVQAHRWCQAPWIREEMERISEHVPERQKREIRALVYG